MKNLTGHPVTLCTEEGEVLHYIPMSEERPLRASILKSHKTSPEGFKVAEMVYSLKNDMERLKRLSEAQESVLVSHIMGNILKDIGYKGAIYTTGKKVYKDGNLVGCQELVEYKEAD